MRLLTALFASCLSLAAIAAEEAAQIELPPLTDKLVLDVSISWPATNKPLLEGITNLPDGTLLEINMEPAVLPEGTSELTVKDHAFSANLGADNGLEPGEYSVFVSMLLPMSQPQEVVAVIGEEGEHIKADPATEPMFFAIEAAK